MLPTYCARVEPQALEDFAVPAGERLILSVHLYEPYTFAQDEHGNDVFDPTVPAHTEKIDQAFESLGSLFVDQGIPVVITEFGAVDKNNEPQRAVWAQYVLDKARQLGMACIWWDAGGDAEKDISYSLYDRYSRTWRFPLLLEALTGVEPAGYF